MDQIFLGPPGTLRVTVFQRNEKDFQFIDLPASHFDQVHYRVDPPVNSAYRDGVNELLRRGVPETHLFNPRDVICDRSEKVPPDSLQSILPKQIALTAPDDIEKAFILFEGTPELVQKPLNLAQSIGVKKVIPPITLEEWQSWLTPLISEGVLLQEFFPKIENGELRMWFSFGKFIGALKKFPLSGDFRVLIDEGSKIESAKLNEKEWSAAFLVGEVLAKDRIALAAIDFIQGKICDYNVTSPGLLVQLEKVHGGENFARVIIDSLVLEVEHRGHLARE